MSIKFTPPNVLENTETGQLYNLALCIKYDTTDNKEMFQDMLHLINDLTEREREAFEARKNKAKELHNEFYREK